MVARPAVCRLVQGFKAVSVSVRMRVLHFYKTYYPDTVGGVEQVIYQICRGAAKCGVESSVLSLTRQDADRVVELEGHAVHRARMDFEIASNAFSASSFFRFSKLAKRADIVHYHFPWPFGDVVHFTTRHKKKTVVTYHSDIVRQKVLLKLYRPLKRRFLADVDRIVATSPSYLETSEVLNEYRHKTEVIPIGLDKSSYPTASPELLAKWQSKFGERFFLFVGMIRYYKGLDFLLDAAHGTEYPVVIVGAGPVEAELKERAARLKLHNVHFLGALSDEDKVALLALCYAVILPSHLRSEAFGVSLLEGAMYGKPMISCEIGTGTSYINKHNDTGLVIAPGDSNALRDAMRFLLENPCIAAEMGARAEQRYLSLFTSERMAKSYVDLYKRLLEEAP